MCIDPSLQAHGLDSLLIDVLETRLRAESYCSIKLQTGRLAPSSWFYERRGFGDLSLVSLRKSL